MTTTRRFDTLADAFLYSSTAGGLILASGHWGRTLPMRDFVATDYYVLDFSLVASAEAAGMRLVDDFNDLMTIEETIEAEETEKTLAKMANRNALHRSRLISQARRSRG